MQDPAGYFYVGVFDRWTHEPRRSGDQQLSRPDRGEGRGLPGWLPPGRRPGHCRPGPRRAGAAWRRRRGRRREPSYRPAGRLSTSLVPGGGGAGLRPPGSSQPRVPGRRAGEHHRRLLRPAGRVGAFRRHRPGGSPAGGAPARPQPAGAPVPGRPVPGLLARRRARAAAVLPRLRRGPAGDRPAALRRSRSPPPRRAAAALRAVRRSLEFELAITSRSANPFGYARQYVQPVDGPRRDGLLLPAPQRERLLVAGGERPPGLPGGRGPPVRGGALPRRRTRWRRAWGSTPPTSSAGFWAAIPSTPASCTASGATTRSTKPASPTPSAASATGSPEASATRRTSISCPRPMRSRASTAGGGASSGCPTRPGTCWPSALGMLAGRKLLTARDPTVIMITRN